MLNEMITHSAEVVFASRQFQSDQTEKKKSIKSELILIAEY